jgi:uncharacterized protein DUF3574
MFHSMIGDGARGRRALALVFVAVTLVGCAAGSASTLAPSEQSAAGSELVRVELLFGRARPDGAIVSDAEWEAFLDEHVTPRFPRGLTVIDVRGQYRMNTGEIVREPSKLLMVLHDGGAKNRAALEEIRQIYKQLFDQESVLIMSAPVRASF